MSTTTGWDIPGYESIAPQEAPQEAPVEADAAPAPQRTRRPGPIVKWSRDMRDDMAARKARTDGRWWLMRWMSEQPTSVRDHLDFVLHQRYQRPDGRQGWGLQTEATLVDGGHALLYRLYGLLIGLPVTMLAYALGWMAQRPGRALLLALAVWLITKNVSALGA